MDRIITGTTGADDLTGTAEDELFKGLNGDDVIDGGAGDDRIIGNAGDDVLLGGAGNDRLFGCEDDDVLDGGAGRDFLNAGSGRDTLIFTAAENRQAGFDFYDGHNGIDRLVLNLTAAEFAAARAEIDGFLAFIAATTDASGQSGGVTTDEQGSANAGEFYFFGSLGLAARRIERLQVIVDDEVVIGLDPVAVDDTAQVTVGQSLDGTVVTNDTVPTGSTFELVDPPLNGEFELRADGSYRFTPDNTFGALAEGETAERSFTYALVTPEGDRVTAEVTLSIVGVNDAPTLLGPLTLTLGEDDDPDTLNLLEGASDIDAGDTLTLGPVTVSPEGALGLSEVDADGTITIDPRVYDDLDEGERQVITLTYDVIDGTGAATPQTATIVIIGADEPNTPPSFEDEVAGTLVEDVLDEDGEAVFTLDLLDGVTDAEGGLLTVENIEFDGFLLGDFDNSESGGVLSIATDQAAFQPLNTGDERTITFTYDIVDDAGARVERTGIIVVLGQDEPNEPPEFSGEVQGTLIEDELNAQGEAVFTLDLLDGAEDPEGGALTVENIRFDGFLLGDFDNSEAGGVLSIATDQDAFQPLDSGDRETITVTYDIVDASGDRVERTATITVLGVDEPNQPPVFDGEVSGTLVEDALDSDGEALFTLDLLRDADDPEGGPLAVTNIQFDGYLNGDFASSEAGGVLTIATDQDVFQPLTSDDTRTITLTYDIVDSDGAVVSRSGVITVRGTDEANQPPVVNGEIGGQFFEDEVNEDDAALFEIDLLEGAEDPEGTELRVERIRFDGYLSGEFEASESGGILSIATDQDAFQSLAEGQREVIVVTLDIVDQGNLRQERTVEIEVIGRNDAPDVTVLQRSRSEDASGFSVDLLSEASDVDGDALFVVDGSVMLKVPDLPTIAEGSVLLRQARTDGRTVTVDLSAYQGLAFDERVTIEVSYLISDGRSEVRAFAELTILGENDDPVVGEALTFLASEGEGVRRFDLLEGASDPDNRDEIDVTGLRGEIDGITQVGNTLSVDTSVFEDLADGEPLTVVLNYFVDDGNGGRTPQTATVIITGREVDAMDDAFGVEVGETVDGDVGENDTPVDGIEFALETGVERGTLTFNDDGTFSYDPGEDFAGLLVGQTDTETFTYSIETADGEIDTATVTLTIAGIEEDAPNTVPQRNGSIGSRTEDSTPVVISLADIVGPDAEGDDLTFSNITLTDDQGSELPSDAVNVTNDVLTIDPGFYNYLNQTEDATITIAFDVSDGTDTLRSTVTQFIQGVEDTPVEGAPLEVTISETDDPLDLTAQILALVTDADQGDDDLLSIVSLASTNTSTPPAGANLDAGVVTFDPQSYADGLETGESLVVVFVARVDDDFDAPPSDTSAVQEVRVTIEGFTPEMGNSPPVNTEDPVGAFDEDEIISEGNVFILNLTENASDPDGDPLSVTVVSSTFTQDGTVAFDTIEENGQTFLLIDTDQAVFQRQSEGEDETFTLNYTIDDGQGGSVGATATVVITGVNDAPETSDVPLTAAFSEDELFSDGSSTPTSIFSFNGVEDATDVEFDALSILSVRSATFAGPSFTGTAVATSDGTNILVDTAQAAFQALSVGQAEVLTVEYEITDGMDFVVETVEITVTGVNDAPTTSAITVTRMETDASFAIDPLQNAVDVDQGDVLSFDGDFDVTGDDSGLSFANGQFTVDPGAYTALNMGQSETLTIVFDIEDGNGASVEQTIVVTIEGEGGPVNNNPPGNFTAEGSLFIDASEGSGTATTAPFDSVITDPNGGTVTFLDFVGETPAGLSFDAATGRFEFDTDAETYDFLAPGDTFTRTVIAEFENADGGKTDAAIDIFITGTNDLPEFDGGVTFTPDPFSSFQSLDLLGGPDPVSDVDGDYFRIENLVGLEAYPDAFDLNAEFGDLFIDTFSDDLAFLAEGEVGTFNFTYDIVDAYGGRVTRNGTITITGENDAPEINASHVITLQTSWNPNTAEPKSDGTDDLYNVASDFLPDSRKRIIDLLAGATDAEGDPITVTGISISSAEGIDYSSNITLRNDGSLGLDFSSIADEINDTITIGYTLSDGTDTDNGTVTVNLISTGEVDSSGTPLNSFPGTASGSDADLSFSFTESTLPSSINLFQNLTDADEGTEFFVESVVGLDPFEVFLRIDRDTGTYALNTEFDYLGTGETETFDFRVAVGDQAGGFITRNVSITIEGENDAPEQFFNASPKTFTEDDNVVFIDLADTVIDADDDALSATVTVLGSTGSVIGATVVNGTLLRIDTGDFGYLSDGQSVSTQFDVTVSDGNGASVNFTQDVTINGVNDLPILVQPARFFDNDVFGYQFQGQQGFFIQASDLFNDGDGAFPGDNDDILLTATVVEDPDGTILPIREDANGNLLNGAISFDASGLDALFEAGERQDFTINWTGRTGDGDMISGTFIYRIEGTTDFVPPPSQGEPLDDGKLDIAIFEPARDSDAIEGLAGETLPDLSSDLETDFPDPADILAPDQFDDVWAMAEGVIGLAVDGYGNRWLYDMAVDQDG